MASRRLRTKTSEAPVEHLQGQSVRDVLADTLRLHAS
jgi:hypothetical protein